MFFLTNLSVEIVIFIADSNVYDIKLGTLKKLMHVQSTKTSERRCFHVNQKQVLQNKSHFIRWRNKHFFDSPEWRNLFFELNTYKGKSV